METIILSKKSPNPNGGRSMDLGALIFGGEGRSGLFTGYDPKSGNKYGITFNDLENLLGRRHYSCRINMEIEQDKKTNGLVGILSRLLIPKSFKEAIKEEIE